jgi:hypothetical protein
MQITTKDFKLRTNEIVQMVLNNQPVSMSYGKGKNQVWLDLTVQNSNTRNSKLDNVLDKILASKPDPKWSKLREMSQDDFQNYLSNIYE